jgi:CPA2 family monovalent cation:H+ antiporter-2
MLDVVAVGDADLGSTLLDFGLLILGLGILARIAGVFGLSAVPLFLVAGLLFGEDGPLPIVGDEEFLSTVAELGAIMLLLMLGLEYSARELVGTVRTQWFGGLADLVLNFAPGALMGLALGWPPVAVVALGGITYVSSSGIVAQVVKDLKWRRNPETARVVGILVVEDIAMAPYLPIVTALATGASVVGGLISVSVALGVVGLVILIALRRGESDTSLLDPGNTLSLLLSVFGAAVAIAGFASLTGFSSAVAAFLVGLLLTGEVANVARASLAPLRDLFAAAFFVFFGFITPLSELPGVFWLALILTVATIGTKYLTAALITRDLTSYRGSTRRAGALLVARGEFSVVVAGIATTSAVAPRQLSALTAAYVLLTAVAGPTIARFSPRPSRRLVPRGVGS